MSSGGCGGGEERRTGDDSGLVHILHEDDAGAGGADGSKGGGESGEGLGPARLLREEGCGERSSAASRKAWKEGGSRAGGGDGVVATRVDSTRPRRFSPTRQHSTLVRTSRQSTGCSATYSLCTRSTSLALSAAAVPARERTADSRRARSGGEVSTRWIALPRPRHEENSAPCSMLRHADAAGSPQVGALRGRPIGVVVRE